MYNSIMNKETIHFTVPKTLKARWVAYCNAQTPKLKLVPWLIQVVEDSLDQPIKNAKSADSFGIMGEAKVPVILNDCECGTRARWENLSRAESLRMTDWFVNRVEQFKD